MATAVDMAKRVAELRKAAKDTSIPQEARNKMLDQANELEAAGYEKMKAAGKLAKGGVVKKKEAKASAGVKGKSPVVAVMIGMTEKPKKAMAKGGMAKKGKY